MSARSTRRTTSDARGDRRTSVVGSTIRDVSARLSGRGLPKGGLREQDGLKVAEGALPDSTLMGSIGERHEVARRVLRVIAFVSGALAMLLIALAIALAILSKTSAFMVSNVETFDSDHVTADEVTRLAAVEEGTTLLNVDAEAIQEGVKRNPWVASVEVERVFPDALRLRVNEREPGAVVAMSSGGVAWLLGTDNVWIEPLKFEVTKGESSNDAALAQAASLGIILISDVPSSVAPEAGSECTDDAIQAVMSVSSQLSDEFKQRIVCYSASSEDDISCILENGVEISMGSNSEINTKEAVAKRVLEEFGGQVTYINVRIPSRPTYRRVDSEYVREGTGATGDAVDEESVVPKVRASEDDSDGSDGESDQVEGATSEDIDYDSYDQGYDDYSGYYDYDQGYDDYSDYSGYDDGYDYSGDYDSSYEYDYGY